MKNFLAATFIFSLFISCESPEIESQKEDYFSVEELNEKLLERNNMTPVWDYYTRHNIILVDSTEAVFYHDKYFSCGTGWSPGDPPRPIDLTKGDLKEFNTIGEVVMAIRAFEITPRLVMIASNTATIRGEQYFELVRQLRQIERCYILKTRMITEDERVGLEWERGQQ